MTRPCMACDAAAGMIAFREESMDIEHRGQRTRVDGLSGLRCPSCGEVEFSAESAARYAAAGDALVIAARRATGEELRRIRKKLQLKQSEAALLTGGGHNAFSRYETGAVEPSQAVINLFRLLEKHPEELETLKAG